MPTPLSDAAAGGLQRVASSAKVNRYTQAALADNTKRSYKVDLAHFRKHGGTIPTTEVQLAEYLANFADSLAVATLQHRVIAIHRAHVEAGLQSPAMSPLVKRTLQGIRRTKGTAQRRVTALVKDDIIELVASSSKFCKHFHIPLQSGDPDILRSMRRRYGTEQYSELISKINSRIPEAGIGVDVITGFPGETEDRFTNTFDFIDSLQISYLHVFTYSERRDTDAAMMTGRVDVSKRRARNEILRNLSAKKKFEFYSRFAGAEAQVLFESAKDNGTIEGYTSNYIRVRSDNAKAFANNIASVILKNPVGRDIVDCELLSFEQTLI